MKTSACMIHMDLGSRGRDRSHRMFCLCLDKTAPIPRKVEAEKQHSNEVK